MPLTPKPASGRQPLDDQLSPARGLGLFLMRDPRGLLTSLAAPGLYAVVRSAHYVYSRKDAKKSKRRRFGARVSTA